ncbi:MAG: endonuclease III [bacterium]|nr:endonuclease III [Candidatus Kapabacteria bacterium]
MKRSSAGTDATTSKRASTRIAIMLERLSEYLDWDSENRPSFIDALVATVLSQNTTDVNSGRAYAKLGDAYSSWDDVADSTLAQLAATIREAGLAEQKATTIIAALNALRDKHGSLELAGIDRIGDTELLDELTSLKGIGLKTASCVLMFALGRDLCAVDTHIHRVANRVGIVTTTNPDRTFEALRLLIPPGQARNLHVALIRFGRRICKSQRPHCFDCPLFDLCEWELKEQFAREAKPGARAASGDVVLADILRNAPKRPRSRRT